MCVSKDVVPHIDRNNIHMFNQGKNHVYLLQGFKKRGGGGTVADMI